MESRDRSPLIRRRLLGVSGIIFTIGALFFLFDGDYWLALSQIAFALAMALIFFGAEERDGIFKYLIWICFTVALAAIIVAGLV